MVSANLAAAAFHYRGRRYERAAALLAECSNTEHAEHHHNDPLFSSLPKLALEADTALCKFRSASSRLNASKYNASDRVTLLVEARTANRCYFTALEAVVCQLNHGPIQVLIQTEDYIDTRRLQTSMAILMNSVSMFWLILHLLPTESESQNRLQASMVIQNGVRLAACCFRSINPKTYLPTWTEGMSIIERVCSILSKCEKTEEDESSRMLLCLQSIHHVISISELQHDAKLCHPSHLSHKNDRNSYEHLNLDVKNDGSNLACHDLLVQALCLRLQGRHKSQDVSMHDESSSLQNDSCGISKEYLILNEAIEKYDSMQATILRGLFLSMDALQSDDNLKLISAIDALKPFAQRSPSIAQAIASLHVKQKEYKVALEYLCKALSLNDVSCENQLNITSDIAMCFAKLGEPEPVVELLLHWISTLNQNESVDSHDIDSIKISLTPTGPDISSVNKTSVLWRLLFASELVGDVETSLATSDELSRK